MEVINSMIQKFDYLKPLLSKFLAGKSFRQDLVYYGKIDYDLPSEQIPKRWQFQSQQWKRRDRLEKLMEHFYGDDEAISKLQNHRAFKPDFIADWLSQNQRPIKTDDGRTQNIVSMNKEWNNGYNVGDIVGKKINDYIIKPIYGKGTRFYLTDDDMLILFMLMIEEHELNTHGRYCLVETAAKDVSLRAAIDVDGKFRLSQSQEKCLIDAFLFNIEVISGQLLTKEQKIHHVTYNLYNPNKFHIIFPNLIVTKQLLKLTYDGMLKSYGTFAAYGLDSSINGLRLPYNQKEGVNSIYILQNPDGTKPTRLEKLIFMINSRFNAFQTEAKLALKPLTKISLPRGVASGDIPENVDDLIEKVMTELGDNYTLESDLPDISDGSFIKIKMIQREECHICGRIHDGLEKRNYLFVNTVGIFHGCYQSQGGSKLKIKFDEVHPIKEHIDSLMTTIDDIDDIEDVQMEQNKLFSNKHGYNKATDKREWLKIQHIKRIFEILKITTRERELDKLIKDLYIKAKTTKQQIDLVESRVLYLNNLLAYTQPFYVTQETVDIRYLEHFPLDKRLMVYQSTYGTGKTTQSITLIKKLIADYDTKTMNDPDGLYTMKNYRILWITVRRTQNRDVQTKLKPLGFQSYLDGVNCDKLTISPESLYKLEKSYEGYDLVVIDEIHTFFKQMASGLHGDKKQRNQEMFDTIVSNKSSKILAMDATITNNTLSQLYHRTGDNIYFVKNNHQPQKDNGFYFYDGEVGLTDKEIETKGYPDMLSHFKTDMKLHGSKAHILAELFGKIIDGNNVVVCVGSQKVGLRIETWLKSQNISHIYYHSGTSQLEEYQRSLSNIKDEWTKYQVVMYSPTISVGIDFNDEEKPVKHFDYRFLITNDRSCTQEDYIQMLLRVRHINNLNGNYIYATNRVEKSLPLPIPKIKKHIESKRKESLEAFNQHLKLIEGETKEITDDLKNDVVKTHELEESHWTNNLLCSTQERYISDTMLKESIVFLLQSLGMIMLPKDLYVSDKSERSGKIAFALQQFKDSRVDYMSILQKNFNEDKTSRLEQQKTVLASTDDETVLNSINDEITKINDETLGDVKVIDIECVKMLEENTTITLKQKILHDKSNPVTCIKPELRDDAANSYQMMELLTSYTNKSKLKIAKIITDKKEVAKYMKTILSKNAESANDEETKQRIPKLAGLSKLYDKFNLKVVKGQVIKREEIEANYKTLEEIRKSLVPCGYKRSKQTITPSNKNFTTEVGSLLKWLLDLIGLKPVPIKDGAELTGYELTPSICEYPCEYFKVIEAMETPADKKPKIPKQRIKIVDPRIQNLKVELDKIVCPVCGVNEMAVGNKQCCQCYLKELDSKK